MTSDPSLPKHLVPPPPVTPVTSSQTLVKAASTGDLHLSSTLSFLVGDHSNFECVAKPPIMPDHVRIQSASDKDIPRRTATSFSSFIVLDMPRSLSASNPLPPIGSTPSKTRKPSKKRSKKLKAPKTLPALRTRANGLTSSNQQVTPQQQDSGSVVSGK